MNTEELQTFVTLARTHNFTRTAEEMHLVQSTVSNRIRALEEHVGSPLLDRKKSGVELTKEGEVYLQYAQRILELDRNAVDEVYSSRAFDDRLNLVSVNWLYDRWVYPLIGKFAVEHPNIALNVDIAHGEDVDDLLIRGLYDIAYTSYPSNSRMLETARSFKSSIVFVTTPDKAEELQITNGISKKELSVLPLVYTDMWDNCIADITDYTVSVHREFRARSNMLHISKLLCLSTESCCFLPKEMILDELEQGILTVIPTLDFQIKDIETYMVYNKEKADSLALRAWLELVGNQK
jgi:LysR family transcriptional repressor of citA